MSQLQHSPGPWTYDTSTSADYVFDADDVAVCKMVFVEPGDIKLIAAAPDMLRLLREVVVADYDRMIEALGKIDQFIARLDGGE